MEERPLDGVEDGERNLFMGWSSAFLLCSNTLDFLSVAAVSQLTAMWDFSLCPREQPETLRIWIGNGESTSEKKGWDSSGAQPHEHCPLAHLLEPLATVFAMSLSPWPPPPPPESSSPVSRMGGLVECVSPLFISWVL